MEAKTYTSPENLAEIYRQMLDQAYQSELVAYLNYLRAKRGREAVEDERERRLGTKTQ